MKKLALALLPLFFAFCCQAQTLIAHYDFSSTVLNPTTATDITGGYNGAVTSCTAVPGKCGLPNTAMKFNGTTSFVSVAATTNLNLTKWTIQAIVFINGFETSLDCQVDKILQHGNQYSNNYYALEINDNNDDITCGQLNYCNSPVDTNGMRFYGAASGSILIGAPSSAVHTGRWYCLTATYSHDTMKTYVNGVLNYKRYWPNAYNYIGSAPLLIGKGTGSGGTTYHFNGIIDDVRIYNDALTASQVAGICDSCVSVCKLDDVSYCSKASTPLTYTFTATPSSTCVYWTFGDGSRAVTTTANASVTHTFPGNGSFNVCAIAMNCATGTLCETQKCFSLCIGSTAAGSSGGESHPTGVKNEEFDNGVGMPYPNPTNSILFIPVQGLIGDIAITVTGMDGKLIISKKVTVSASSEVLQLSTMDLAQGTYLLGVSAGDHKVFKRFSKL